MSSTAFQNTRDLVGFLVRDGELLKSPVLVFAFVSSASRTAMIYLINEAAAMGGADLGLFGLLLAAVVVNLACQHFARVKGTVLVANLAKKLRRRVSDNILNADVSYFQQRDFGHVYSVLAGQSMEVAGATTRLVEMVQAILLLIFCLCYMIMQSWATVLASVVALGFGVSAFLLVEIPARRMMEDAQKARVAFFDTFNDMLRGYKELRLRPARRVDVSNRVDTVIEDTRVRMIAAERYFSYGQVAASAALAALLLALVTVIPLITEMTSVLILQLLALALFTSGPIEAVVSGLPGFARAGLALRQFTDVQEELTRNPETEAARSALAARPAFRSVELRGVTAVLTRQGGGAGAQAQDSFRLGPIDMSLHPGQSVFITGGNGMGKSTLLQLLTGLRHPDDGQILLDGQPVTRDTIGDYRGLFSAVFSEFYLFRHLYGLTEEERARLQHHIEELGLADGVSVIGDRFSSLSLSTGQMRRLALSIALAEQRPIIVLDEFAADQDPSRRAFFYDVLVPRLARAGKLVIAVTHDEQCFGKADRLIRMEDGKIVSDSLNASAEPPGSRAS